MFGNMHKALDVARHRKGAPSSGVWFVRPGIPGYTDVVLHSWGKFTLIKDEVYEPVEMSTGDLLKLCKAARLGVLKLSSMLGDMLHVAVNIPEYHDDLWMPHFKVMFGFIHDKIEAHYQDCVGKGLLDLRGYVFKGLEIVQGARSGGVGVNGWGRYAAKKPAASQSAPSDESAPPSPVDGGEASVKPYDNQIASQEVNIVIKL